MSHKVCQAFVRPKLIHGLEYQLYYLVLLVCLFLAFNAFWNWRRLLLIPVVYFGLSGLFRWAGQHDDMWMAVYGAGLRNRTIFWARSDPKTPERRPEPVLFKRPKWNA